MSQDIRVEVVFAGPESQVLVEVSVPAQATVSDAIRVSALADIFPEYCLADLPVGIWGRLTTREQALRHGDRVEIYRELAVDPMQARRLRAAETASDPCVPH